LPDIVSQSYRKLKVTGQLYTWELFSKQVDLCGFFSQLETKAGIFMKGLPRKTDLRKPPIAHIFSNVLRDSSIVRSEPTTEEDDPALLECFRKGWLHADKSRGSKTVYIFASPLHQMFVEWKLQDYATIIPFESNSILQLALEVIAGFSPRLLSAERRIGSGSIQRPAEAQYQDEFYRCCHMYSNGSLITFPEYGTQKGRVDFYIPSKNWGVELLRDGDQLEEHWSRFSEAGAYGATLSLSDYIILDFRKTMPKRAHHSMCIICQFIYLFVKLTLHTGMRKLYHVVFSQDDHEVSILDHMLEVVDGGRLRLLYK
jgi:hypothetical protein